MNPNNIIIEAEYEPMKEDEIISMIKGKLHLSDDNKGRYEGYHLSGTSYTSSTRRRRREFSQTDIMTSILKGNDTFAILPTGSGKSACYQGPSMFVTGVTFVVSPLIALIEDQIDNFNKRKIRINDHAIRAISPGIGSTSTKDFFDKIIAPQISTSGDILYKLAYISPERLSNPKFQRELSKREKDGELIISLLVVDEAHCLSQSSLDFRESYLYIYDFIQKRPFRPTVCAFTATASQFDKMVIERVLGFTNRKKYNFYESIKIRNDLLIFPCPDIIIKNNQDKHNHSDVRFEALTDLLKDSKSQYKRTVIFCTTVAQVDWLYEELCNTDSINKYRVHRYHSSMTRTQRKRSLKNFSSKKYFGQIMVCTKAMGMGIDINDISLIIHYDIPRTLEDYYQEIGRGARGNNQIKAFCYLLYESGAGDTPSRGSVKRTEKWIRRTSTLRSLQHMSIASRLSLESQCLINQMNLHRYYKIRRFINKEILTLSSQSTKPQIYIIIHLKLHMDKRKKQEIDMFLADLESVLKDVYEFHFGNNPLVNMLRWHSNEYELNEEKLFSFTEWSRKHLLNERFHTIIKTDIASTSAFVVIKGIKELEMAKHMEVLRQLNEAWHNPEVPSRNAVYLYLIADSRKLTILELFVYDDGEWKFNEDDPLRISMTKHKTDVKGLLPESRYPEWHSFINRKKPRDKKSSVGPFAIIRGSRRLSGRFMLVGDKKPDYFDLCVSDAIYTLHQKGITHIYTKKIWEILSGDPNVKFSRADSRIKISIEESVKLLSDLKVCITDNAHGFQIENEPFISIRTESKTGFLLEKTPPIYRYSELLNGEFIRVPISLFSLHIHQYHRINQTLSNQGLGKVFFGLLSMPEPSEIKVDLNNHPLIPGGSFSSCHSKYIRWPKEDNRITKRLVNKGDFRLNLEYDSDPPTSIAVAAKCRPWQATIENCVICHYLVHRISITRGRRRGDYLNFDNMLTILAKHLTKETANNRERFIRKVLAVLSYYREIGYANFVAYTNNPSVLSSETANKIKNLGEQKTKNTIIDDIQVEYGTFVTIRRVDNVGIFKFHDINLNLTPSVFKNGNFVIHVNIEDLTGVRFIKQEQDEGRRKGESSSISIVKQQDKQEKGKSESSESEIEIRIENLKNQRIRESSRRIKQEEGERMN